MKRQNNTTTFWVSYADLMAGLLFVFILLIGAIIIKYSLLQSESELLEANLVNEKKALELSKKDLEEKKKKIENTESELNEAKNSISNLKVIINSVKNDLSFSLEENENLKKLLEDNKKLLEQANQINKEKEEELVLNKKTIDEKQNEINVFENLKIENEKRIKELRLSRDDLIKSLDLVNESEKKKDEQIKDLASQIILKEKLITAFKNKNSSLDDELKVLNEKLKNIESKHTLAVQQLDNTKEKIKNLTGIKIKVITILKDKLGKKVQIDPKNGSIRLSSNILFDEGKYELKEESKDDLKNAVYDYFNTILENEEINRHIDKIIVEGHTNSKGSFLYNLELSQKRAYSVMSFLLDLDFEKKDKLKDLVAASGRSFLDPIYNEKNLEDRDKSRRIEIKFRLKNEQAIKEIESIFD